MAYAPPSSNAVNFTVAGSAYTPPANTAVDFTSYVLGVVSGAGAATYSPVGSAAGAIGAAGSCAATYSPQATGSAYVLVSGTASVAYIPQAEGVGDYTNSAIGDVAYSPAVAATADIGPPSYSATVSASYRPKARGWETPPTAIVVAQYRPLVSGAAGYGVTGAASGRYIPSMLGIGAHGRSANGTVKYVASVSSLGGHGIAALGAAPYKPSISGIGSAFRLVAGGANTAYLPSARGDARFGEQYFPPDSIVFVVSNNRSVHVLL